MEDKIHVVKKPSAYPFYLSGGVWLIGCVFLKMIYLTDYLICLGLSLITYAIASKLCKPIEIITKIPFTSGNAEVDQLLQKKDSFIREMKDLDIRIEDAGVSQSIVEIIKVTDEIFNEVIKTPTLAQRLRKFMNYYLPTLIKLCHSYAELEKDNFNGQNRSDTAIKIENALLLAKQAFKNQLDDLYVDKAMDISADIRVLETLMKQEGLLEEQLKEER